MKNANYQRISNSLRKYRRVNDLKQKEVAKILGLLSTSMISRWEKGICLPKLLNAFKLAMLYRTMVDALFVDLRRKLLSDLQIGEKKVLRRKARDKK